jgi:hypothetical protein
MTANGVIYRSCSSSDLISSYLLFGLLFDAEDRENTFLETYINFYPTTLYHIPENSTLDKATVMRERQIIHLVSILYAL